MQELFGALSQLGPFLEKLGVVGVLVFIVYYQWRENTRLKTELIGVYRERDDARVKYERCRGVVQMLQVKAGQVVDTRLDDPINDAGK